MTAMTGDAFSTNVDPEPELRHVPDEPRGVLQKNLKMLVYLGAAALVIVAAIFSSTGKKTQGTKGLPPQPMVQDNTDNNVQDLKNQLQAEQHTQTRITRLVDVSSVVCLDKPAPQRWSSRILRFSNSPRNNSKNSSWQQRRKS
jgi:hypothetical protein